MACFITLPTELILHIASYIQPKDIDSFSSISKRIYEASEPLVRQHQNHKRVLGHCTCGAGQSHGTVSQLLETVLVQPSLRFYIKNLTIASWESHWHPDPRSTNLRTRYLARALEGGRENCDIVIQNLKRHTTEHCHLPVLLALLWNLRDLEIVEIPYCPQRGTSNMYKLEEAGNPLMTTFNQQIKQVTFTKAEFPGLINASDIVNAFVRIAPAVESLRIRGSMGDPKTEGVGITYWQEHSIPSWLTRLHMTGFPAHRQAIRYFLKKFTALQSVTWEEPSFDIYSGVRDRHDAHANTVASALQTNNKNSLQDLTLSISQETPSGQSFVRDLSPFRFLSSLTIFPRALVAANGDNFTKLPPSLENLRIVPWHAFPMRVDVHVPRAFAGIIAAKKLPRLRRLRLDNYRVEADGEEYWNEKIDERLRKELEDLQRLCEERGVEFAMKGSVRL